MKTPAPVQPDALPRPDALRALVEPRPGPVVTLYAPLRPSGPGPRAQAAAYQGAIANAESEMEHAGVPETEARDIRDQLALVDRDLRRSERPAAGLAVFHDGSDLHAFELPGETERSITVAEHFALRPLLQAIHANRRHYVLARSTNRIALFCGDAFGLETIAAHGVPASHSCADEPRSDEHFHQKIARTIEATLKGCDEPVVLIAARQHHAGLRAALRLPSLLEEGVETRPDHLSRSELHARCWPIVERTLAAEEARIAVGYERCVDRGKGLHRIDDVAAAAASGRVQRVWVRPDERVPGAIDPSSGALVGGRSREDVLDGLVTLVLRHGGEVMVTERIPSGTEVAAELH